MPKLQTLQDVPQKVDGKSIANNNGVLGVPKSYLTELSRLTRLKTVRATGGTAQSGGIQGSATSSIASLNRRLNSGTSDVTFTYNIADFTSTDPDFHPNKIIAVNIRATVLSDGAFTAMGYEFPDDYISGSRYILGLDHNNSDLFNAIVNGVCYLPVNEGQSTFVIKHFRDSDNTSDDFSEHNILSFVINPYLPIE